MRGKRTGACAVAWCQALLMQPVIYGGSVWGRARDPLEWFLSDTPDPYQASPRPTPGLVLWGSTGACSFRFEASTSFN
jgi:hypothetical protein